MIIALFPNTSKPRALEIAKEIGLFLRQKGVQVIVEDQQATTLDATPLSKIEPKSINFIISLGGDGTILRLIHRHPELQAPLLGINLGGLGFMADIPFQDIYPGLEDLLDGRFTIQPRMMMEGFYGKEKCMAINEMVIHRAQNPSLIDLSVYVDGLYLNTFAADGLIISTPNGSTAYSLAAGGPIVSPELEAFILTPICPHTISNRPIVLQPKKNIEIRYLSPLKPVEVSYDGISTFNMNVNDIFKITSSTKKFNLVKLPRHDYFTTLREKLGWSGKMRAEKT